MQRTATVCDVCQNGRLKMGCLGDYLATYAREIFDDVWYCHFLL
jgi:hypothetical protein